jgi:hypothetical protein
MFLFSGMRSRAGPEGEFFESRCGRIMKIRRKSFCKECLLHSSALFHFICLRAMYVVLLRVAMATFVPGNQVSDTNT